MKRELVQNELLLKTIDELKYRLFKRLDEKVMVVYYLYMKD